MKTSLNSNSNNTLTLQEVMQQLIVQEVNNGIKRKTIESGGVPIGDITDVQKKVDNGTVTSVNYENYTCVVKLENGSNITLDLNIDFRTILPSNNTSVVIAYDSNGNPFIQSITNPYEYSIDAKSIKILGNTDKIVIQSDTNTFVNATDNIYLGTMNINTNNGGLIIIQNLVNDLNRLVDEVKQLKNYITTHTHTSATPGLPTTQPVVSPAVVFTQFNRNNFENTKVKH